MVDGSAGAWADVRAHFGGTQQPAASSRQPGLDICTDWQLQTRGQCPQSRHHRVTADIMHKVTDRVVQISYKVTRKYR